MSVMKRILFPKQQILKEQLQEFCCFMNTVFQIVVVCPDKRIAEIPCVLSKDIICYIEAQGTEILDKEYRRRSGIAFSERMDLPQP